MKPEASLLKKGALMLNRERDSAGLTVACEYLAKENLKMEAK